MGYRIGIDVGGTFTDFTLVRPDASIQVNKAATTPKNEAEGVLAGLRELADREGVKLEELLARTDAIVHGTTTADNTLIDGAGSPTGLITTEGHRDEIEIRRGWRENIWDPQWPAPPQIVKRRFRLGVAGRLDYEGDELTPLDEDAVRRAARRFRDHGIESIAVVLLFSFVDPRHERRAAQIIAEEAPDARVHLSHEVLPAAPEFERTSTTLVNAFVGPRVVHYLESLVAELRDKGYAPDLLIMQSNGGVASVDAAMTRPIVTLASGPAGGVAGTVEVAKRSGVRDFIGVDMGGTSYDVCLVRNAEPVIKSSWNWIQRHYVGLPMVDVLSIGAGGGSIAKVKAGGLTVGPESAGADPGPICYGKGGTEVTVTDANFLLGYLNPDGLCGGTLALSRDGVEQAMRTQVAEPLGLSVIEAAAGIHRLTTTNMNNAIRRVSSERGHDPRQFDLVAFGGNGPLHATGQALDMGIDRVVAPRLSPVLSAFGVLAADFVINQMHSVISEIDELDRNSVVKHFAQMRSRAEEELTQRGLSRDEISHHHEVACRYPGQTFTLPVPLELDDGKMTNAVASALKKTFHQLHEELHTFRSDEPVVVGELRLRSIGRTPKPDIPSIPPSEGDAARVGTRSAYFDGEMIETPVYDGSQLGAGQTITGPAIIEETFTTVLVHPSQQSAVDEIGNHVITRVS